MFWFIHLYSNILCIQLEKKTNQKMLVSSDWQDTSVVREKWCLIYISGKTNIQHGHQVGRHITGDIAFKIVRIKLAHPAPSFFLRVKNGSVSKLPPRS